ncbi:MAG: hypothetical protein JWO82_3195 [Akkermansiaceae bacterium]|nr:hypothetical protein [Akkermansiaceae bacterium]
MIKAAVAVILLTSSITVRAQADFNLDLSEETRPPLLCSFSEGLTIYRSQEKSVWFSFHRRIGLPLVDRDAVAYHADSSNGPIPIPDYEAFLQELHKLPLADLNKQAGQAKSFDIEGSLSGLDLAEPISRIAAGPNAPVRQKLEELIQRLLEAHRPFAEDAHKDTVVEGATIPAREVTFAELLLDPQVYHGKRVRLTGYYHGEFEGSCFREKAEGAGDWKRTIWLGGASVHANPDQIDEVNDDYIIVEGTYSFEDKGHMGMFAGSLCDCTRIQRVPLVLKIK